MAAKKLETRRTGANEVQPRSKRFESGMVVKPITIPPDQPTGPMRLRSDRINFRFPVGRRADNGRLFGHCHRTGMLRFAEDRSSPIEEAE